MAKLLTLYRHLLYFKYTRRVALPVLDLACLICVSINLSAGRAPSAFLPITRNAGEPIND